jgi:hypothetical protein
MATPYNIPAPPAPTAPDITQYVDIAKKQLDPGFSDLTAATTAQGAATAATFNQEATDTTAQVTTLQKQYGDLESEFKTQEALDTGAAQKSGDYALGVAKERVGAAEASLGAAGVGNAQGSFRAPVTQAENAATQTAQDTADQISKIAASYGAKEQDITDTLDANTQQLQQKAAEYRMQGNEALAGAVTKVAQMTYEHEQQITSLAQQMSAAETTYEQNNWKDYMDLVTASNNAAKLQVMESHYASMDAHYSAMEGAANARIGISQQKQIDTQNKNKQTTMVDYNKQLQGYAKSIAVKAGQGGISREAAISQLQQAFPDLDPTSIKNDIYGTYTDTYKP